MESFLGVENSCRGLKWVSRCQNDADITALEQDRGLDNLTSRLLAGRKITPDSASEFLKPTLRSSMPDPSTLKDMDKAASLIMDAVQAKHKITIFADYDVDGGSSAALIVIDHHLMQGDMPPCAALVNPNREDDESGLGHLAAAGVTFMVLVALNREARRRGLDDVPNLLNFIGLTALGTLCDVVSLTGLNRALVSQGLRVLSQGDNIGIRALADIAGTNAPYTTYDCGFILGPRINAGGRIGKAEMGAELLSTENAQLAYAHAAELDRVNTERKSLQDQMINEALEEAHKLAEDASLIIVDMTGWHPGIIGIVAGRLKDRFDKPAIVIGVNEEGIGKGSGRSMPGVNLGEAITKALGLTVLRNLLHF